MTPLLHSTVALVALGLLASGCRNTGQANRGAEVQPAHSASPWSGQASSTASIPQDVKDGWITTKIQARYFADANVKGQQIYVSTANGVVTLRGSVENDCIRATALQLARNTGAVAGVHDRLTISPEPDSGSGKHSEPVVGQSAPTQRISDIAESEIGSDTASAWATTRILSAYFLDPLVKRCMIEVHTNNGVVTLRGTVMTPEQRDEAASIARGIEGVRGVDSRLTATQR
jgi:osmotically-inducible protein OsmY